MNLKEFAKFLKVLRRMGYDTDTVTIGELLNKGVDVK